MTKTRLIASEDAMRQFAASLAPLCTTGDCLLLEGDLGTGKTTFARGFIQSLCREKEEVVSPTFTLVQRYQSQQGTAINHFDLYRIKHQSELQEIGLEDALVEGITLIEWPEIAKEYLPAGALRIQLNQTQDAHTRNVTLVTNQDSWGKRLNGLRGFAA